MTLNLGKGRLNISIWYENIDRLERGEPHYNVSVFGSILKGRSSTIEEAKERAVRVASKWLAEATEAAAQERVIA